MSAAILNGAYEVVALDALKVHPRNPRRGDVGLISRLIQENGFYGAVIAQKSSGHILVGNHRFLAAREQGQAAIPVIWVDVDDEHALRILLSDNRSADESAYDDQLLTEMLGSLPSVEGTGWSEQAVTDLLAQSALPAFEAQEEEQGRLDHLRSVECPQCHHSFELPA